MNREKLNAQVKEIYNALAADKTQQHFHQTASGLTATAYYEDLLGMVQNEIAAGTFDDFHSGQEIVNAVANDKKWLSEWDEHSI